MTESFSADVPLDIDRVHGSRSSAGEVRLVLTGRWRGPRPPVGEDEALLVVQLEGRRHRFPADRGHATAGGEAEADWSAVFTIPGWAEPRHFGQASVWIGNAVIPVPAMHSGHRGAPPALAAAVPVTPPPAGPRAEDPYPAVAEAPTPEAGIDSGSSGELGPAQVPRPQMLDPANPLGLPPEPPRTGPLSDLLLKETVSALHSELDQRMADSVRLRGALSDAQSELDAKTATQAQLETTLAELGGELKRLIEAVEDQRRELDENDAAVDREREAAQTRLAELAAAHESELSELTAAHERKVAELTAAHERQTTEQVATHDARISELTETGNARQSELAAVRERLAAVTAASGESEAEIRTLRAQLTAVHDQAERRAKEAQTLRDEMAALNVSRDVARSEADGLRSELERVGAELAVTRERVSSESGDLGQASRLLADARALAERLRSERREA